MINYIQNLGWKFWILTLIVNCILEDVDVYYWTNLLLIVILNLDAISTKRLLRFIQYEDEELQWKVKDAQIKIPKGDSADVEHAE
ncbi:MFS sugar transporter [Aspergillus udagawae]|uniref:MFS sugar transporter n=1 Tax=Aspergillus udagawae TaxID=91492 RepID=A0A8H3XQR2_9EURO|nr:MFS sugar transporter [Aspergillus udagawae]